MILIQLLAAVKEMRCQKQKRCKPEQKIITSRNVLQIIPLKIQLCCFSSLLFPQIFLFSDHWIETYFNSMNLCTWWHQKYLCSFVWADTIMFRRFAKLIFLQKLHQMFILGGKNEEDRKLLNLTRRCVLFWLSLCSKIKRHVSIFWTHFFCQTWVGGYSSDQQNHM